ncbi:hypothetical protein ACP275_10G124500 [Erythranthe tilingii]
MRKWMLMFLLLLSILIHEAQGIRMSKGSAAVRQHSINEVVDHGKRNLNEGVNNSSGKKKRKLSRAQKGSHHLFPRFHEDYYGPRIHRPKHH